MSILIAILILYAGGTWLGMVIIERRTKKRDAEQGAKFDAIMKAHVSPIRILFDYAEQLHDDFCQPFGWKYKSCDLPPVVEMAFYENPMGEWLAGLIREWKMLKDQNAALINATPLTPTGGSKKEQPSAFGMPIVEDSSIPPDTVVLDGGSGNVAEMCINEVFGPIENKRFISSADCQGPYRYDDGSLTHERNPPEEHLEATQE